MSQSLHRWRTELRDLLELWVLPGLAACLPWRWCVYLFRKLSCLPWLYRSEVERAVQNASIRGAVQGDVRNWAAERRFTTLVDHADYHLIRSHGLPWMREIFQVRGRWPEPGVPGLVCTFHWGCGAWALPHMRAAGLHVHALVAALDADCFHGRQVLHAYAKARTGMVAKQLGRPTLDVSESLRPVIDALRQGEQILAVLDVPADQVSAAQTVTLRGMQARVPTGMLRLAVKQHIPVTLFLAGLEEGRGRFLEIRQLGTYSDLEALMNTLYTELDRMLYENSAAWHFWGEAERFFVSAAADNMPLSNEKKE